MIELDDPVVVADALAHRLGVAALRAEDAGGTVCVDVAPEHWVAALAAARDVLGCVFFDWLSAVDEPGADPPSVDVVAHLVDPHSRAAAGRRLRRLLLRTRLPDDEPTVASATPLFAGAAWHERETAEMFGVEFAGFDDGTGQGLRPLLLPDGFEGTPLRKSFVLAARVAKPWPGAKEPGEGGRTGEGRAARAGAGSAPARRTMLPPGVPEPGTWGPPPRQAPDADPPGGADAG